MLKNGQPTIDLTSELDNALANVRTILRFHAPVGSLWMPYGTYEKMTVKGHRLERRDDGYVAIAILETFDGIEVPVTNDNLFHWFGRISKG